jgi:4-aminobutyrate aminotransferase
VVVDTPSAAGLYGTDGESYLDFTTGIGVTSLGHCHPKVVEAERTQVDKIIHAQYMTVMHQPLSGSPRNWRGPAGLDSVFYATSGSDAVEAAIELARMAHPGAEEDPPRTRATPTPPCSPGQPRHQLTAPTAVA